MITVHHLENSRSQRVLWLLEELGVSYDVKRYERDPVTKLAPASLRAVHPLGKSPVVVEDGRVLAETGAIVEHLIERHGGGALGSPADEDGRERYRFWLHFAEGSAMPPLVMTLLFSEMERRAPALLRPVVRAIAGRVRAGYLTPTLAAQFGFMEAELARRDWFAGEAFSAADVMMSFPVEAAASRVGLADKPLLRAWLERIHARPAYARALARGGAYAYA